MQAIRLPKSFFTKLFFFCAFALATTPALLAGQSVISVQFQDNAGNGANNIVTGTAGAVPVANWNTSSGANGTLNTLKDSTGTATTASVTWTSANTWSSGTTNNGGDDSLLRGYLDDGGTPLVTVTNVPYATYDVYVYSHGDAGVGSVQGKYFVDSVAHATADTTNFQFCTNGAFGNYQSAGVTYLLFRGLTSPTLVISARMSGGRAPLNGFQIVANGPGLTRDISADFVARGNGTNAQTAMGAGEFAGAVGRTNWNSLVNPGDGPPFTDGSLTTILDESGNTTGASVTWGCADTWSVQGTPDSNNSFRMMKGYISANGGGNATFTVTGLPAKYAQYDIYCYTDTDANDNGGTSTGTYALTGATPTSTITEANNAHFTGPFIQSSGGSFGNYVKFGSVNGATFTVTANTTNGTRAGINGFQIIRIPPSIASILAPNDVITGGSTVTINGASFSSSGVSFSFGGAQATNVTYVNPTQYTVTVPAHAAGTVDVVYSNGTDTATLTQGFTYVSSAPPTLTSVVLTAGGGAAVGSNTGGTSITLKGTNFVAGDIVKIGGTNGFTAVNANSIVVVNSTTITCNVPAVQPAGASGPTEVSVIDPSNNNATALILNAFKYTGVAPVVTSLSPASGAYTASTIVQISGTGIAPNFLTNLTSPGSITVGGQLLTNLSISGGVLTGTVPPMTSAMSSRNQDTIVTNPDGTSSTVNAPADYFTYILRDPENDTGLQPGVIYRYYNNTNIGNNIALNQFPLSITAFNKMGVRNAATPFTHPTNANLFDPGASTDNIAVDYVGILNVPADGIYFFHTPSDDASVLYIGTTNVINNNGGHGTPGPAPDGSIGLKAGFHRIRVQWTNGGGGYGLNVQWNGPTFTTTEDIPLGSADFTARGIYCDATPTVSALDTFNGPLAGGTTVNVFCTNSNFNTPTTFPGTNAAGASTLTSASLQGIALTRVASSPTAGQFTILGQNVVQLVTPAGTFAGGAPIVLTTLNGLTAVLQPLSGGYAYNADGTNYRTPENPASTAPGVNVKFFRTGGTSTSIAGTGALLPSGGVTSLDSFNPIKGLSLGSTTAATNLMTGPLADPNPNGTLLSFRQDDNNFYMKATGYIQITTPGLYTFTTNSDDESRLFFGSAEVVSNVYPTGNAGYAITAVSNLINLGAGKHKYTILYGQNIGNRGFALQYAGPDTGNALVFVPDSVLFADSAPPAFATTSPLSVATGSSLGNTTVTATGTNFAQGAAIYVNGVQAGSVQINSTGTAATFRTPAGTAGQTVNVVIVNPNGMPDTILGGYTFDSTARPPTFASVAASPCVPGTYFRYYSSGTNGVAPGGPTLPNFAAFTPSRVGVVPTAEYLPENTVVYPATQGDGFSFQYTGYILIPADGTYSFYTASDDGSTMYIGSTQVVIGNNNPQGITTRTGPTIALKAGLHEYTVQFAEGNGGYGNYVGWGTADGVIPMDPNAVYNASNNTTSNHGGAPTTRIPAAQYYYIPPTFQTEGTSNWSTGASWDYSTNVGLGNFGPVQNTNADDGLVDTVFRFNGDGAKPFTAVNDSINNTPLYVMELNSNVNGNVISGNTLKTLGATRFVQYNSMTLPSIIQNGSGTVTISAPIFNRDSLVLTGNGTGVLTLSGTQSNYASGTDIKNIVKSGTSQVSINGNASVYIGDGATNANGRIQIDGGTLGIDSTVGAVGATAYNAKVGTNGTAGTLRGKGTLSGLLTVGANGTVMPGSVKQNPNDPTDPVNQSTNGELGTLTVTTADLSAGGTLRVRIAGTPGSLTADRLAVSSTTFQALNLSASSTLDLRLQLSSGNYNVSGKPTDVELAKAGDGTIGLDQTTASFGNVTNSKGTNLSSNLTILYTTNAFVPNTNDTTNVVATQTLGAGQVGLGGNYSHVYLRISGNVTPVKVDSFTADAQGAGVLLSWNCVSEFQNAGFNVYRRTTDGGAWSKVNASLISGRVTSADSKTYHLYDWASTGVYDYKLESISTDNVSEPYHALAGPVTVDPNMSSVAALFNESLNAASGSVASENNSLRAKALSALFAASTDDAISVALPGIGEVQTAARAVGAATSVNATKSVYGTVKVIDMSSDPTPPNQPFPGVVSGPGIVADSDLAEKKSIASAAVNPLAASRWFSGSSIGASSSFVAAKVQYSKPGVMLVPASSIPAGIDINHVAIQREGRALPALARTSDGLVVFGQGYEDDYTNRDALFLRPTAAPTAAGQVTQAQGLFAGTQTVNTATAASATQSYHDVYYDYNNALRPYTFPPWFSGQYLSADASTGTTQSFTLSTPFVSNSAATLTVNAWSLTTSATAPNDHALQVVVNGVPAGQVVWSGGNKMVQLTFVVPSGTLLSGNNTIELVTPPIAGVTSQIAFLHSLTCTYTRSLDGSQPVSIYNTSASSQLYELSNFPGTHAWVVDARFPDRAALVPYASADQGDGTFKIRFVGGTGGTGQFMVVPLGMENAPLSVTKRQVKPVKAAGSYLAVGPNQFNSSIQPLLAQRSKEGLRGQFVDQEQMFDYYNNGRYGPAGIQNAVRSLRPQYLMLVGRTTYDYKNYSGLNIDPLCPSFLISTSFWAQTTSDATFGDLGRGYSEVRVGRLPANDPGEASVAVKHILSYSGMPVSGWRGQVVADEADPAVGDFAADCDQIIAANPSIAWTRDYYGVTYPAVADVTEAMRKAACGDADFILYTGHGNAARLGNNVNILDVTSVKTWTGDIVLIAATCTFNWVAKDVQDYRSIAIQALVQPQGGIAASIGSTTYMNSGPGVAFAKQLIKQSQGLGAGVRWGDVLMKSQQWAYSQSQSQSDGSWYLDLSRTECLLGDPAMPVYGKSPAKPAAPAANGGANTGTF